MKRSNHLLGWALALLMGAALCAFSPSLLAQSQQQQPPQTQTQPQTQAKHGTFLGTIMKLQNGKYALVTGKTPQGQLAGHFLDNQTDAKKFEGKKVKVTGTLDMASNTIHVTNIVAA